MCVCVCVCWSRWDDVCVIDHRRCSTSSPWMDHSLATSSLRRLSQPPIAFCMLLLFVFQQTNKQKHSRQIVIPTQHFEHKYLKNRVGFPAVVAVVNRWKKTSPFWFCTAAISNWLTVIFFISMFNHASFSNPCFHLAKKAGNLQAFEIQCQVKMVTNANRRLFNVCGEIKFREKFLVLLPGGICLLHESRKRLHQFKPILQKFNAPILLCDLFQSMNVCEMHPLQERQEERETKRHAASASAFPVLPDVSRGSCGFSSIPVKTWPSVSTRKLRWEIPF